MPRPAKKWKVRGHRGGGDGSRGRLAGPGGSGGGGGAAAAQKAAGRMARSARGYLPTAGRGRAVGHRAGAPWGRPAAGARPPLSGNVGGWVGGLN